jgi:hypothetical protein
VPEGTTEETFDRSNGVAPPTASQAGPGNPAVPQRMPNIVNSAQDGGGGGVGAPVAPPAVRPAGTTPLSSDQRRTILNNERTIRSGVLAAARQVKTRTFPIEIERPSGDDPDVQEVVLQFEVCGLTDKQREQAQREFMEYTETASGMVMPDMRRTSAANQRALQIYTATIDKTIWDDPATQQGLHEEGLIADQDYKNLNRYVRAVATIQASLYAPEIDRVINIIDTLGANRQRLEGIAKRPGPR